MKPVFGDEKIIVEHHRLNVPIEEMFPLEGRIFHYDEYGKEIKFECVVCDKEVKINLTGENSTGECCGIIYNKKYRYGREVFFGGYAKKQIQEETFFPPSQEELYEEEKYKEINLKNEQECHEDEDFFCDDIAEDDDFDDEFKE